MRILIFSYCCRLTKRLCRDAAEVAKDLVEISQLDASAAGSGSENDLMQLEEYVRVGVQIIYAVLAKIKNEAAGAGDE